MSWTWRRWWVVWETGSECCMRMAITRESRSRSQRRTVSHMALTKWKTTFLLLSSSLLHWHTWLRLPSLIFNLFPAEFEVGASPICKDPLGWMFSRLDTNFDLQLDQSEIKSLYLDRNEPCSDAFFRSCDTHADKVISSSEWCTCFQRYTGTVSPCTHMQTQNAFTPEYACKHRCHSASVSVSCESEVLISYNNLVLFSCVIRNYD